jgi:hypothetical protein
MEIVPLRVKDSLDIVLKGTDPVAVSCIKTTRQVQEGPYILGRPGFDYLHGCGDSIGQMYETTVRVERGWDNQ